MSSSSSEEQKWDAATVRRTFLEFFEKKKQHTFIESSPVVPHDDPTLLFANAGMNQFKPIFLGQVQENTKYSGLTRAHNTQKCIRAGGKHNDLDDVGKDVYHHTFFEMLGNWSFGDYFKEEAIAWAWELLTEVFGIDPARLYATYFGGAPDQGLEPDNEARDIWLKYLPANRVLPFDMKDNFWEMGDVGPCGPCSELHYDRIGGRDAAALVNMDDPDVLEIWNLVFMQFNREASGELRPLPARHVDTGMGFERVVSVLQNKSSNYDTDVFMPIFEAISKETGALPYTGKVGEDDKDGIDMAYRVVADHIRTLTFSLTDGAVPSKDGRGYVLRRILRRASRYGRQFLNAQPGFFANLVDVVVERFGDAFPELKKNPAGVKATILDEEMSFAATLDKGLAQFEKYVVDLKKGDVLSGRDACTLYDTFGFPIDLTERMCEERGLTVDMAGYEKRMDELRDISRNAAANDGDENAVDLRLKAEQTAMLAGEMKVEATDDSPKFNWKSIGKGEPCQAVVRAIYVGDNAFAQEANKGARVGIITDRTNFYAEAGGQIYDIGTIKSELGAQGNVVNCQRYGTFVLHEVAVVSEQPIKVGDAVTLDVDWQRRSLTAKNHTCTHLLNFALRDVLGEHVDQKGSLVDPQKLRFDFSNNKGVAEKDLAAIEEIVRKQLEQNLEVFAKPVGLEDALTINGLRAVFGETYPDPVRVVSVGQSVDDLLSDPGQEEWRQYSVEFCGGTHMDRIGEARDFAIVSETGIAKGVRRITAYTYDLAREAITKGAALLAQADDAEALSGADLQKALNELKAAKDGAIVPQTVSSQLAARVKKLEKKYMSWVREQAKKAEKQAETAVLAKIAEASSDEQKQQFVVLDVPVSGQTKALNKIIKTIGKKHKNTAVLLVSRDPVSSSAAGAAIVPKALQDKLNAGEWLGEVLKLVGGRCGPKPATSAGAAKGVTQAQLAELVAHAVKLATDKFN
eukprot:TRINITY_DN65642_c6_g1_i1.p1 TRINITY_DN65642_c6_g1~~TRINITY_DN65642_c6_g1_i1.p1  ORF type:complete len:970 (+),score=657.92 TRINITY_DN65642_c6_g1_i1:104-3013(+)